MTRRRRSRAKGQSSNRRTDWSSDWRSCRLESQCVLSLHCGVRLMRRLPRHTPLILPVRLSHTFHVAFSDHSSKSRRIQLERGRLVYVCMLKRKTPTHKIAIFTMSESHTLPVQIQIGRSENCNFTFTFCYVLYLFLIAFARRVIT